MRWLLLIVVLVLVELNCLGQNAYAFTIGGNQNDQGKKLIELADGNLLLIGSTGSFDLNSSQGYMVKFQKNGTIIWSKTIGTEEQVQLNSGVELNDKSLVLIGYTNETTSNGYSSLIYKVDSLGNFIWKLTYNENDWAILNEVVLYQNFLYVVGRTYTLSDPSGDIQLAKIDLDGNLIWQKGLGEQGIEEYGKDLIISSDNQLVLVGTKIHSDIDNKNVIIYKTDTSGTILWQYEYGDDFNEEANAIFQNSAGDYFFVGYGYSPGSQTDDYFMAKLNSAGAIQANHRFGLLEGDEEAFDIGEFTNGELGIIGKTNGLGSGGDEIHLTRIDTAGTILGSQNTFGGFNDDIATSLVIDQFDSVFVAGSSNSFSNSFDCFVMHAYSNMTHDITIADVNLILDNPTLNLNQVVLSNSVHVYPNPIVNTLNIDLSDNIGRYTIYSALGIELVVAENLTGLCTVDFSSFASGVYVIKIYSNKETSTFEVVKL